MTECNLLKEENANRCMENCDNEYTKFKFGNTCIHDCLEAHQYYLKSNYERIDKCLTPTIYLTMEGNEYISGCKDDQYKREKIGNFRCVSEYGTADVILKENCNENYFVEDTHKCFENCYLLTNKKYVITSQVLQLELM